MAAQLREGATAAPESTTNPNHHDEVCIARTLL
jgi:hypothetical protein